MNTNRPVDQHHASIQAARPARNTAARRRPIVPTVLYFADQTHPYRLPAPQRLAVAYATPQTVRLADPGAQVGEVFVRKTLPQTLVWCIPDDTAWTRLTAAHTALQQALDAIADALRHRGRYDHQLATAGGFAAAPNPLSPTAIAAIDPDASYRYWSALGAIPQLVRRPVAAHTPKMLRVQFWDATWSLSAQHQFFVCPTDTDWTALHAAQQAVQAARTTFDHVLDALGRYHNARVDGRSGRLHAPAAPPVTVAADHQATDD